MVLAAGLGTRLRPLTLLRAKPALPVLGRPLLRWTLEALARYGFDEVVVNTHHLPATVRRAVGSVPGLSVRFSHEPRILGTGGGPRKVRRWLGEGPVLVVNGDVAFDLDLTRLVERHLASGARVTLGLRPNPDPERYGPVVTDARGRVLSIRRRPRPGDRVSLFTGLHVLDPALLARLPPGPSDSVGDLYVPMIDAGERVDSLRLRGPWFDLGTPDDYRLSQLRMLRRGFASRPPAALLVDPSARVHSGARVSRSVVGERSVVAEGASVVDSVLWAGVRVGRGARVEDAILADGVEVLPGEVVRGGVRTAAAGRGRR